MKKGLVVFYNSFLHAFKYRAYAVRYNWLDNVTWTFLMPIWNFFFAFFIGKFVGNVNSVEDYAAFIVVGQMTWVTISRNFNKIPNRMSRKIEDGSLSFVYMPPTNILAYWMGDNSVDFLRSVAGSFISIFLMQLFGLRLDINWFLFALSLVITWFSIIGFSLFISGLVLFLGRIDMFVEVAAQFLRIISGVFFPITVLPGFLILLAKVFPMFYLIEATRLIVMEGASFDIVSSFFVFPIIFGVVSLFFGNKILKLGEKYAKREGVF